MVKTETSLPTVFMFDRNIALLTIRTLSENRSQTQPQLLTFFHFAEDNDDELLCAIIQKLDPNQEECRIALLDIATSCRFSREVASVALDQIYKIRSWKLRKIAYGVISELRDLKDIVWQVADGYSHNLDNVFDLEERRR